MCLAAWLSGKEQSRTARARGKMRYEKMKCTDMISKRMDKIQLDLLRQNGSKVNGDACGVREAGREPEEDVKSSQKRL